MKASAIVPAHNEESHIARVLTILCSSPLFSEVLVVNDGSTDDTSRVAKKCGARVLTSLTRIGKGRVLDMGVRAARNDVVFFCDADISGLSHDMLQQVIVPVLNGTRDMSIAARKSKIRHMGFGMTFSPLLDGQRAITKELWSRVPEWYKHGYEIESALNHFGARSSKGFIFKHYDISQVRKEEKRGFLRGSIERYVMYRDIALAQIRLKLMDSY